MVAEKLNGILSNVMVRNAEVKDFTVEQTLRNFVQNVI